MNNVPTRWLNGGCAMHPKEWRNNIEERAEAEATVDSTRRLATISCATC